jgi:hypothetical protein
MASDRRTGTGGQDAPDAAVLPFPPVWSEDELAQVEAHSHRRPHVAQLFSNHAEPTADAVSETPRPIAPMTIEERKAYIADQITLWVGKERLYRTLTSEELGRLRGADKLIALRNSLIIGGIRHCRLHRRADTRLPVLTLITFLADNDDGICRLSITRMCKIFLRSRETVVASIVELEKDGQIDVIRSDGMVSCYRPLVPAAPAALSANPVWFVDALTAKH